MEKEFQEKQDVVFIDAYNLIYRAFHGNQAKMTNPEGLPTNAIYTVTSMLLKLRGQFSNLAHALVVFDGGGNFRKEIDPEYKINRKPMPEELKVQMPYLKEVFEILGWPCHQAEGVEADDIISTLAVRAEKKGFDTYIVSSDKDFRQIVTDNLKVLDTQNDICYTPEVIKEKMGVYPENVAAWLALLGDTADNIIGIDKVGKVTASKLLTTYGNIENVILNKDLIAGVVGQNIRTAIENGHLAKNIELATVKTDLDINLTRSQLTLKEIDQERWQAFCTKMNFRRFNTSPKL